MGNDLKSPGWGTNTKMNPNIYQLYLTQSVAGMEAGHRSKDFINGVNYLKDAMKNKIPVMVGVDDAPSAANKDKVTDHFVVLVGMGSDTAGDFFYFYDNATSNATDGTSADNRIYADCTVPILKGTGPNAYVQSSTYQSYVITQIRESK